MAVVLRDQVGIVLVVDGVVVAQLYHLFERVVDEDKADEGGEALLREACEVLHQEAGVRGHQHQAEQARPQADPQPELEVVKAVVSEERREDPMSFLLGAFQKLLVRRRLKRQLFEPKRQT